MGNKHYPYLHLWQVKLLVLSCFAYGELKLLLLLVPQLLPELLLIVTLNWPHAARLILIPEEYRYLLCSELAAQSVL
jgi:hypothetical protein